MESKHVPRSDSIIIASRCSVLVIDVVSVESRELAGFVVSDLMTTLIVVIMNVVVGVSGE